MVLFIWNLCNVFLSCMEWRDCSKYKIQFSFSKDKSKPFSNVYYMNSRFSLGNMDETDAETQEKENQARRESHIHEVKIKPMSKMDHFLNKLCCFKNNFYRWRIKNNQKK